MIFRWKWRIDLLLDSDNFCFFCHVKEDFSRQAYLSILMSIPATHTCARISRLEIMHSVSLLVLFWLAMHLWGGKKRAQNDKDLRYARLFYCLFLKCAATCLKNWIHKKATWVLLSFLVMEMEQYFPKKNAFSIHFCFIVLSLIFFWAMRVQVLLKECKSVSSSTVLLLLVQDNL